MSRSRPPGQAASVDADRDWIEPSAVEYGSGAPLVPRGGIWEGQVAVVGRTVIEGTVNGSLRGPGELILGRAARVEGAIECDVVDNQGEIIGPVVARTRVRLGPGTRLHGDLEVPLLEVDDDAEWNGAARIGR